MKAPDPWCATGRQQPAISDDRQLRLAWRALVDAQLAMLSRASQAIPAELRLAAKRPGRPRRQRRRAEYVGYASSSAAMPSSAGRAWI